MRMIKFLLLAAVPLLAQADTWVLLRGIYPGQTTHVHTLDGVMHAGGFISTTDANIVIRLRTGDQTITKDQIKKVSVRKSAKRWRNAGIGAATGAAFIGILFGATDHDAGAAFVAGGMIGYAIIGGGIGALFPGYETLYRAPRK